MTVSFWNQAEWFYETIIIILAVLILLCIAAAIFAKSAGNRRVLTTNRTKKIVFWLCLASAGILFLIGLAGHLYYQPYLSEVSLTNPLTRDRERHLFGFDYYSQWDHDFYTNLNYIDQLRTSSLYQEEAHRLPIDYLGRDSTLHYFKNDRDEIYRVSQMDAEYADGLDQAQLAGSTFKLQDESFKDIGFKNPEKIMFEKLLVPRDQKDLQYQLENQFDLREDNDYAFIDWVF